jgi:hypothetical protein
MERCESSGSNPRTKAPFTSARPIMCDSTTNAGLSILAASRTRHSVRSYCGATLMVRVSCMVANPEFTLTRR